MNKLGKKVGHVPTSLNPPFPTSALCNATLCPGVPFILGPAPVVSPNVDTIYAAGYTDLSQAQALNVPNPNADPDGARYYSVTFYDMYTNVVLTIDNNNYPTGGLFCVVRSELQFPICNAAIATATKLVLPRFMYVIARVYSEGRTVGCVDPVAHVVQEGVDGCATLDSLNFVALPPAPAAPLLNPFTTYLPLMNPTSADACAYKYGHAPCFGGNNKAFWDAVCRILVESPPSAAEAAYINANFADFGIHSTGCVDVKYETLAAGFAEGYASVAEARSSRCC
jgi:hypothetical protein